MMNRVRRSSLIFLLCLVFFSFCNLASAYPKHKPGPHRLESAVIRDPTALSTIAGTVAALQGTAGTSAVTTVQLAGNDTDGSGGVATVTYLYQATGTGFEFRKEAQTADDTVFVSGHGSPAHSRNGAVKSLVAYMGAAVGPTQMPLLILGSVISNSGFAAVMGDPVVIGGVTTVHVQITNTTDPNNESYTVEDWYFDPNTSLPLRVECVVPDPFDASDTRTGTEDFANYQSVGGYLVPLQTVDSLDGSVVETTVLSTVQVNITVNDSQFNLNPTNRKVRR